MTRSYPLEKVKFYRQRGRHLQSNCRSSRSREYEMSLERYVRAKLLVVK